MLAQRYEVVWNERRGPHTMRIFPEMPFSRPVQEQQPLFIRQAPDGLFSFETDQRRELPALRNVVHLPLPPRQVERTDLGLSLAENQNPGFVLIETEAQRRVARIVPVQSHHPLKSKQG